MPMSCVNDLQRSACLSMVCGDEASRLEGRRGSVCHSSVATLDQSSVERVVERVAVKFQCYQHFRCYQRFRRGLACCLCR